MRGIETSLDEILAFRLGDEGLELRRSEGVHEAGLGHDEQEDLRAGESGELVGLEYATRRALNLGQRESTKEDGTDLFHDTRLAF